MKKLFVLLLALTVVGLAAYAADEPTVVSSFSAYVDGGLQIVNGNGVDTFGFYGSDSGKAGGRFNFNGNYAYGDYGLKFRLRADGYVDTGYANTFVRRGYGYFNLMGGKVWLGMGIFGIGDFATTYNGAVAFDNPNKGLLVEVKPMDGMIIGYGLPATKATTALADGFNASTVAFTYAIPKLVTLTAWVNNVGLSKTMELVWDINVTAVENLSLSAEGDMKNLGDSAAYSYALTENVAYTMGALIPGIWLDQTITKAGTAMDFNPNVEYDLEGGPAVGADLNFGIPVTGDNTIAADAWAKWTLGKNWLKAKVIYDTNAKTVEADFTFLSAF